MCALLSLFSFPLHFLIHFLLFIHILSIHTPTARFSFELEMFVYLFLCSSRLHRDCCFCLSVSIHFPFSKHFSCFVFVYFFCSTLCSVSESIHIFLTFVVVVFFALHFVLAEWSLCKKRTRERNRIESEWSERASHALVYTRIERYAMCV